MSKVSDYLQEHLLGTVTSNLEIRRALAHDASVLELVPAMVVYPASEDDVRKTNRFAWQLAERGKILGLTARGAGTGTTGGSIGKGALVVFTAHMNKILGFDPKKRLVTVEPGLTYDKLQHMLYSHGLFLPSAPADPYATVGGGVATNTIGERSTKYSDSASYTDSLQVVLANGEAIQTELLDQKELNHKLGLTTFEGEIYRALDGLIEENHELINSWRAQQRTRFNSAGYNIFDVKTKDGFDLTPLIIGSQGTLGIITQATLQLEPYWPDTDLALIGLDNLSVLSDLLPKILDLKPAICNMVDGEALSHVLKANPNQLNDVVAATHGGVYLFVEFDEPKSSDREDKLKSLAKLAEKFGASCQTANPAKIRKLRSSVATILTHGQALQKAVPLGEDISLPTEHITEFLNKAAEVYKACGLPMAVWGPVGAGVVRLQPLLDLAQLGDRQKFFKLSDGLYKLAAELGGSTSAGNSDGRVRAPYLPTMYGEEIYSLMLKIKDIFDPHGILNPGVKTASQDDVKAALRSEYVVPKYYDHPPLN